MKETYFKELNADLGYEFHLFTMEHPDWVSQNVPQGAIVVLQTDDAEFNAWARKISEQARKTEQPMRPMVLVHVRELRPEQSRIVRVEAELVATPNDG